MRLDSSNIYSIERGREEVTIEGSNTIRVLPF